MKKITTEGAASSPMGSPLWETLEAYARAQIQQFVQRLLEEEVDDLLGRAKSERGAPEAPLGYRNGYGKPRQLALTSGTITVRRPREAPSSACGNLRVHTCGNLGFCVEVGDAKVWGRGLALGECSCWSSSHGCDRHVPLARRTLARAHRALTRVHHSCRDGSSSGSSLSSLRLLMPART